MKLFLKIVFNLITLLGVIVFFVLCFDSYNYNPPLESLNPIIKFINIVLISGLSPLLISIYYFSWIKEIRNNFLGLLIVTISIIIHVYVVIFSYSFGVGENSAFILFLELFLTIYFIKNKIKNNK